MLSAGAEERIESGRLGKREYLPDRFPVTVARIGRARRSSRRRQDMSFYDHAGDACSAVPPGPRDGQRGSGSSVSTSPSTLPQGRQL